MSDFLSLEEILSAIEAKFISALSISNDSILFNPDSLMKDKDFIYNRIKSEIAGTIWGKDEATSIRLDHDNQISEALKYFNEADAFLEYRN